MQLDAKFLPPSLAPWLSSRRARDDRMDMVGMTRLCCLVAPAGSGKTTAMARQHAWLRVHRHKAGWINLDEGDDGAELLLIQVALVLERALAPDGATAPQHAGRDTLDSLKARVLAVCNALTLSQCPLALFLDDYHRIGNPGAHAVMEWLLAVSPHHLKMFVGSRCSLPLKMSKLRLGRSVTDIGAAELSLTRAEASDLIARVSGRTLSAAQIDVLQQRTEGWVAGLQLAALAIEGNRDIDRFIAEFSGSDHDIASYLMEVVLAKLPPGMEEFLSRTALFDSFSGDFCQTVLHLPDAYTAIAWIEIHKLFLVPLDRRKEWFRYHHLFADYLRTRYVRTAPARASADYCSAARWCERMGRTDEAIRYCIAGGADAQAMDLILASADILIRDRAGFDTLLRWIAALPREAVAQRPQLRLVFIRSCIWNNRFAQAESALTELEYDLAARRMGSAPVPLADDQAACCGMELLWSVLHAFQDKTASAAAKSRAWLARWSAQATPLDVARAHVGIGYSAFVADDFALASQACRAAEQYYTAADSYSGVAWTARFRCMIGLEQGRVREAGRVLAALYLENRDKLGADSLVASHTAVHLAQAAYELHQIAEASAALDNAITIPTEPVVPAHQEHGVMPTGFGMLEDYLAAYLTKARLLLLDGESDRAHATLHNGIEAGFQFGQHRLARILQGERVRMALAGGDLALATQCAQRLERMYEAGAPLVAVGMSKIRLQLASGANAATAALIRHLLLQARLQGRQRLLVKLLALQARCERQLGHDEQACAAMHEALLIGDSGGLCRAIADEGDDVRTIVAQAVAWQEGTRRSDARVLSAGYVTHLLMACGAAPQASCAKPAAALSEREIEVLALAASGLGNRELALRLFLSEGTVKWHLHNVFDKLAVRNRSSAISVARSMQII
jgi:LuxR family maltose regulon positive regulatory protein